MNAMVALPNEWMEMSMTGNFVYLTRKMYNWKLFFVPLKSMANEKWGDCYYFINESV
jgi:hypothetical protein